jgi:hypothetical protein
VAAGDVLVVGLVEHDQAAGRDGVEQRHQVVVVDDGAGRVVGRRDEHDLRKCLVMAAVMARMSSASKRFGTATSVAAAIVV